MIIVLTLVFVLGLTSTAFAGPFADVPAKHWAYGAINQLAKDGIVDGYGDGTFRGDKTMTRYEMAQIVGKAVEREDKANAADKALIDKLSVEFAQELQSLGVRVTALEKKVGNITLTGQVREWYQTLNNPVSAGLYSNQKSEAKTRLLLWANAQLTDNITFTGRLWAESDWGSTGNGAFVAGNNGNGTGANVSMDEAYLTGKDGDTVWTFGRQPITLGKGLVYNLGPLNDGATITVGDQFKVTAAAFKNILNLNMLAANADWQVDKDFDLTAVYAKNRNNDVETLPNVDYGFVPPNLSPVSGDIIQTWAAGLGYKGIPNFTITGEYGQNSADQAKLANNNKTADAWVGQVKWMGSDWSKPNTYGIFVDYRKADPGFMGLTGDPLWEVAEGPLAMNNIKGFDYGVEYTVFNNAVLTLNYQDLTAQTGTANDKAFIAQLRYAF